MAIDEGCMWTHLGRCAQRHGGMDAEFSRFIGSGGNDSALVPLPTDDDWLAFQGWIEEVFHGDEEGVHVDVGDGAGEGELGRGSHGARNLDGKRGGWGRSG